MKKIRSISGNNDGMITIEFLGTSMVVAVVVVLSLFAASNMNNHYETYDQSDAAYASLENLISRPGLCIDKETNWEDDIGNMTSLGLAKRNEIASGTIAYNGSASQVIINWDYLAEGSGTGGLIPPMKAEVCSSPSGGSCFLEGTSVLMSDGTYKDIEKVEIGDMVKSYDETSKKLVDSKVTYVYHHTPKEMASYYLVINNYLRVTPNHLIYTKNGWEYAGDLDIWDKLYSGSQILSIEKVYKKVPTYNLEIERTHNYMVKTSESSTNIVHNDFRESIGAVTNNIGDGVLGQMTGNNFGSGITPGGFNGDSVLSGQMQDMGNAIPYNPMGEPKMTLYTKTYCLAPCLLDPDGNDDCGSPENFFDLDFNYDIDFYETQSGGSDEIGFRIYDNTDYPYGKLDKDKIDALQTLSLSKTSEEMNQILVNALDLNGNVYVHLSIVEYETNEKLLDIGPSMDYATSTNVLSTPVIICEELDIGVKDTAGTITIEIL